MDKKYFFFDYDGTLAVPRTKEIPLSTLETIDKLREKGHFVGLATGRLQINALDYIKSVGITNIVADGGYSVTIDGELRSMHPLEFKPAQECLRRLDRMNIPWAVTVANELVRYSPCECFDEIAGDYYVPTQWDPDLSADSLSVIYKIYFPCKPSEEPFIVGSGALDSVPWIRYNPDTIFIEPMDKQRGIKEMMDYFQAPYRDVVVFGDGKNDLSMFLPEWTSIAMGNAKEELKERADYVTDDCDRDGIEKACEHFGWI